MNKPITLCDKCKEYARCCLNYDGDNCRRSRTVEPTNGDRIRSMTDEELSIFLTDNDFCELLCTSPYSCDGQCETKMLNWLKQEVR